MVTLLRAEQRKIRDTNHVVLTLDTPDGPKMAAAAAYTPFDVPRALRQIRDEVVRLYGECPDLSGAFA